MTYSKEELKKVKEVFIEGLNTFERCFVELGQTDREKQKIFDMIEGWNVGFVGLGIIELDQAHKYLTAFKQKYNYLVYMVEDEVDTDSVH